MKSTLFFISFLLISIAGKAQLFINEVSQGASGNKDYIELVVAGTRSCTDSTMDLRGIIVDDNAGWYGAGSFNEGCFRFPNNNNWSAVPYGSVILIYNSADKNPAINLADDPTDADHDYVYVVADSSQYLESSALPSVLSSSFDYSTAIAGNWMPFAPGAAMSSLAFDDSTDVVSIINPSVSTVSATHSLGWGWLSAGGAQNATIQLAGNANGGFNLYHTGNSPATQSLWAVGVAATADETPGAGNTAANTDWIESMRVQPTAPGAPAAIAGPASLCVGSTATYTIAPVAGATSYKWNVPAAWSGASTDTSITITVASTDALSVSAQNGCGGSAVITFPVTSITPLAPPTAIAGMSTACAGSTEIYSVPNIGQSSLVWSVPSGWNGVNNGADISCNIGTAGGTISAVVTDVCGTSTTLSLPVIVNAYVTPSVSVSASSATVCSGTPATFTATAVNGGTTPAYQWLVNGVAQFVSGASFTTSALRAGDSVSVILSSAEQCLTTNDVLSNNAGMQVLPSVTPNIQISSLHGNVVCQGTTVIFSTTVTNGGSIPFFVWYKNGQVISGAQTATYSSNKLSNGDTIYAALISNAVCPTKDTVVANPLMMTVNPTVTPLVKISASRSMPVAYGSSVTFTGTYSGGGANPDFQWLKNGQPIPFATSALYTASGLKQNDTISLRMTSHVSCPSSPVVVSNAIAMANWSTGIDQTIANSNAGLTLYPNPSNGQFTVDVEWTSEHVGQAAALEVLNMMGQVVYHTELMVTSAHSNINISLGNNVAKGMYHFRLSAGNMQAARQLVIQ